MASYAARVRDCAGQNLLLVILAWAQIFRRAGRFLSADAAVAWSVLTCFRGFTWVAVTCCYPGLFLLVSVS